MPSRHHRTARRPGPQVVDLGLYSVTFSNEVDIDAINAEAYRAFRADANQNGMRHFLEVFNPAFDINLANNADIGSFINDNIVRTLAGVVAVDLSKVRKVEYNGARARGALASYDPAHLIVGILGGAAQPSRDTFELLSQAERYGAQVALFGRKIHLAGRRSTSSPSCVRSSPGRSPAEAVKAYRRAAEEGLKPVRSLADDGAVTEEALKAAAA